MLRRKKGRNIVLLCGLGGALTVGAALAAYQDAILARWYILELGIGGTETARGVVRRRGQSR